MSLLKNKRKVKDSVEEEKDEEEKEEFEQDEKEIEDQFEAALAVKGTNTWATGGVRKDVAIRGLIQCFGSMIESFPASDAIPDYRGKYRVEDMIHRKLLDASKQVVKAKK